MGPTPSCARRTTRDSTSRRRTLLKKQASKNKENLIASPVKKPAPEEGSGDIENVEVCATPKADRFRIPEIQTCPPAPKKRRINTSFNSSLRRRPIAFFAPPDIELFFCFGLRGIPVGLADDNYVCVD